MGGIAVRGLRAWMAGRAALGLVPALVLLLCARPGLCEAPPPDLDALLSAEPAEGAEVSFGAEQRRGAMRHAALAWGSRAGLARRAWEIAEMLEGHSLSLDRIYAFEALLVRKEGFVLRPPVAAETRRAFRLGRGQVRAASAERVVRIVSPARLVSAAPDWRDYLVRAWAPAAAPAAVLFPRGREEETAWRGWLEEGWARGVMLAEDIFQADLDRLVRDFEGLVLWHRLELAGMASAAEVAVERRGVSGGGDLLRIGEREAELGVPGRLEGDSEIWRVLLEEAGAP